MEKRDHPGIEAMKLYVCLTAVLLVCACSAPKQSGQEHDFSDGALLAKVQNRTNQLTKLTSNPIPLPAFYSQLCGAFDGSVNNPHKGSFIHVYLTSLPKSAISPAYPVGTFVVKEKLPSEFSHHPELFTAMLKREIGYNPEAGDWEFMVIDGQARTITVRGKINSCLDCHSKHQKTDYLTESWKKNLVN